MYTVKIKLNSLGVDSIYLLITLDCQSAILHHLNFKYFDQWKYCSSKSFKMETYLCRE